MIIDKGVWYYSKLIDSLAGELALFRSKLSKSYYHQNSEKYRGDNEVEISKKGIWAELVARDLLINKGIVFDASELLDLAPIPEPDIFIQDKSFDVKCMTKNSDCLFINFDAHNNNKKKPNFYWFVRPEENFSASHFMVKSSDVDRWKVKQLRYTKAYVNIIGE